MNWQDIKPGMHVWITRTAPDGTTSMSYQGAVTEVNTFDDDQIWQVKFGDYCEAWSDDLHGWAVTIETLTPQVSEPQGLGATAVVDGEHWVRAIQDSTTKYVWYGPDDEVESWENITRGATIVEVKSEGVVL